MSQENVEALRAVYEQWGRGNFRAGRDLFDDRIMMIPGADLTDAGYYVGPERIEQYALGLLSAWDNFTMTADGFTEADNSVVVAVHQGGIGQESGLPGEMDFFAVWTFRGPWVIRLETFRERTEALEAVGLGDVAGERRHRGAGG